MLPVNWAKLLAWELVFIGLDHITATTIKSATQQAFIYN